MPVVKVKAASQLGRLLLLPFSSAERTVINIVPGNIAPHIKGTEDPSTIHKYFASKAVLAQVFNMHICRVTKASPQCNLMHSDSISLCLRF